MAKNNKKQEQETFEGMAQAQWNLNRQRFEFLQNGVLELADLFGLAINPEDGTFIAYHPEKAKLQFPSIPEQKNEEVQQPVIDIDALGNAITNGIESKLQEYLKANPIKAPEVKASVDDSVHIANNDALLESFKQRWSGTFLQMLSDCRICREIRDDGSIIYKVDKDGKMSKLVDEEEKTRQELEKKPKIVRMVIKQVNNYKKWSVFYILTMLVFILALWNFDLHQENRNLELTKKEYMILRWHVNTKPESKAFMEELDSFVKAEGISPVYDRVVEDIKTSKEKQLHNTNKN